MKSLRTKLVIVLLLIVSLVGVYAVLKLWVWEVGLPPGLIQANGRIEGDIVTIASKFQGRVQSLMVREGDTVEAGQVMAQLDDKQVRAQVHQARHAWEGLEAQVQAAHSDLAVMNLQVPLAIEAADAQVAQARSRLRQARAVEKEARNEYARYRQLYENGNISLGDLQDAQREWEVAGTRVRISNFARIKAQKEEAQAQLGWKRIKTKEAEVAALERKRDQGEAALEEVESVLADLTITAPTAGTITTRLADLGEVVSPGAPLFEVVDLDRLYLKVYVPEVLIGKLRLGLHARIYTDAFPDQPFPAVVRYIASRAEFTPKEVQTPDERVKLTYAVKLYLEENPQHRLTPGLPADAVIRWKEDVPWAKPQW